MLYGRAAEQQTIDRLVTAARDGDAGALVMYGAAGVGKSTLLGYAADVAADTHILRVAGIESEAELPYAALHALLRSVTDRIDVLPEAQAGALRCAFGQDNST